MCISNSNMGIKARDSVFNYGIVFVTGSYPSEYKWLVFITTIYGHTDHEP